MNDYEFKLARAKGDFVWHSHVETDEVFLIIEGELRIDFRDARYSYAELNEYQKKVIQDDFEYWKGRGVRLSSVGHHNDGSGLRVGVTKLPENFVKQLEERYPAMSFTVAEEEIHSLPAR